MDLAVHQKHMLAMMGCRSHNVEKALEERIRTVVTEQVQSHAEATTELVRDLGLVHAELSALKEQVQSHAATTTLVRDQGLELSALKELVQSHAATTTLVHDQG